jgi:predicted RNase H-like HicB family nuclease
MGVGTVTYEVLVQERPGQGYRVTTLGGLRCEAEGNTKEEALHNIQEAVQAVLASGEILTLAADPPRAGTAAPADPWMENAGIFSDDPNWGDFQASIADYRREADARERGGE